MSKLFFLKIKKINRLWLLLALLVIGVIIFAYYQFRVVEGNKKGKKPVCNYDHCQKALTENWEYDPNWWNKGQGCHGCTKVSDGEDLPLSDNPNASPAQVAAWNKARADSKNRPTSTLGPPQ